MPQPAGLLAQGGHQVRVAVAQRIDRDAGGEIQEPLAIGGEEIGPLAALESEPSPGICGHQSVGRHDTSPKNRGRPREIGAAGAEKSRLF
jgi:hypothetical protein